jgi:hypothetical protein
LHSGSSQLVEITMLLGQRERLETTVVDFDRAVQLIRETVGALLDIVYP